MVQPQESDEAPMTKEEYKAFTETGKHADRIAPPGRAEELAEKKLDVAASEAERGKGAGA